MTASIASNSRTSSSSEATEPEESPPARHHQHSPPSTKNNNNNKKNKGTGRVRAAPVPNSVLDRQVLLKTLEQHDIHLPPYHVEAFYHNLHRQRYPDLPEFVKNYYQYDAQAVAAGASDKENDGKNRKKKKHDPAEPSVSTQPPVTKENTLTSTLSSSLEPHVSLPSKNAISRYKNRNRGQLPKVFLDFLAQGAAHTGLTTVTSRVAHRSTSRDGSTTKLVIALHDGKLVESVLMRYRNSRVSLCISSQCGCAMGCTFCATGTMGLSGNLTCGEILEQIVHADRWLAQEWQQKQQQQQQQQEEEKLEEQQPQSQSTEVVPNYRKKGPVPPPSSKVHSFVRNVVFMGMGEPLDNYNNVLEACRALIDRKRWNLAHGHVTVSTVGIVPRIRQLTRDLPQVSLAVSLHAPTQAMRQAIVPMAKLYPIEELIDALDQHMMVYAKKQQRQPGEEVGSDVVKNDNGDDHEPPQGEGSPPHLLQFTREERIKESTRRRAMIEYVMLNGPTSSVEAAHALGKLCQDRQLVINLIPYNATDVQDKLSCPSFHDMQVFQKIVQSYGSFVTIRRTMGADIDSACGQLITKKKREAAAAAAAAAATAASSNMDLEDVVRDPTRPSTPQPPLGSVRRIGGKQKNESTRSAIITNNKNSNDNDDDDDANNTDRSDQRRLESWIAPLTIATSIAATCFLVSTVVLFVRRGDSGSSRSTRT